MTLARTWVAVLLLCTGMHAQLATVHARVELEGSGKSGRVPFPNTVIWLTAAAGTPTDPPRAAVDPSAPARLTQKNKSFEPHVLVVPAGTPVEFPNRDPFFHNVFSLFEGKRFDLGLYEAGSSRIVHFDRPGISYIFCNIHPEMSAVVITLSTPFYAVANGEGQLRIPNIPYGRYVMHVWTEGTGPENALPSSRDITIAENSTSLGVIRVPTINGRSLAHKNKYGRDYDAPTPENPVYHQQP